MLLVFRGQAIHNAKIELQNVETENRVLKDALAKYAACMPHALSNTALAVASLQIPSSH